MVYLAIFPGIPFVGYLIKELLTKKTDQPKSRYERYKKMFEYSQKYNP
jgi:hypothetical protein